MKQNLREKVERKVGKERKRKKIKNVVKKGREME